MAHLPSMISVEGMDVSTIRFKESVDATRSGTADECLVERLLEDGAPILVSEVLRRRNLRVNSL